MRHFKTIGAFHAFRELPRPQHPLFSVVDVSGVRHLHPDEPDSLVFDFYSIAVKRVTNLAVTYGQQPFDFKDGVLSFTAPGQVIRLGLVDTGADVRQSGWVLSIHPDFLWNTPLAATIRAYDFWEYDLHEALYLSEKEETVVDGIIRNIRQEAEANIDAYSKPIIVSQLETLLRYAERFYNRQFITREKAHHEVLVRFGRLLEAHFAGEAPGAAGLPTVQQLAAQLHLSPKYLSSLLRSLTGQNAQQHIHETLLRKAKERLAATGLSVSEIAYSLGFEHQQSFSKLFKAKTALSPLQFRQQFAGRGPSKPPQA